MENRLELLYRRAEDSDAELLGSGYADLGRNASLSGEAQQRILSSVMRKAGFEMNENITVKKARRHRKRFAALIAAAAVMAFAVPAGAAYSQFVHESAVMEYFSEDSVRYLEEKGLALGMTDENEHFRITLDTLLSDGNIGTLIMTVEALDEEGQRCMRWIRMPHLYVTDTQTEQLMSMGDWFGDFQYPDGIDPYTVKQMTIEYRLHLDELDTDHDHRISFGTNPRDDAERDENGVIADNYAAGISFDVSLRPNVQVREFQSSDGDTLWLSEIGVYSNELSTVKMLRQCQDSNEEMKLKLKGSLLSESIFVDSSSINYSPERTQPFGACWFYALVDTEKVTGIKVGDTLFSEAE